MEIKNIEQLNKALNSYCPYPVYFITRDGACLCEECVKKEIKVITSAVEDQRDEGWLVVALDVNYESVVYCEHCNDRVLSAYIEDDILEWENTLENLRSLDANGATMFFLPDNIEAIREDIETMRTAIETIEGLK